MVKRKNLYRALRNKSLYRDYIINIKINQGGKYGFKSFAVDN